MSRKCFGSLYKVELLGGACVELIVVIPTSKPSRMLCAKLGYLLVKPADSRRVCQLSALKGVRGSRSLRETARVSSVRVVAAAGALVEVTRALGRAAELALPLDADFETFGVDDAASLVAQASCRLSAPKGGCGATRDVVRVPAEANGADGQRSIRSAFGLCFSKGGRVVALRLATATSGITRGGRC